MKKWLLNVVILFNLFYFNLSDPIKEIYLHGFSDASQSAYAACIYLQQVTQLGNVTVKGTLMQI